MPKPAAQEFDRANLSNATIQKHIRLCSDARTRLEEANGIYRASLKTAKSAGINQRQLIAVMNDRKKDADAVVVEMRDYVRYAGLVGIKLAQLDLFPLGNVNAVSDEEAAEQTEWEIEQAGLAAGKSGASRADNRYPAGSPEFVAWDKGYLRGQQAIAATLGKNTRMADPTPRKNRGRPRKNGVSAHMT